MAKSNLPPSRTKFLSLLKQTAAIEFEIVAKEHLNDNLKVVRESANGDSVILKNQAHNTYQRAQRRQQLTESRQQNNLEHVAGMHRQQVLPLPSKEKQSAKRGPHALRGPARDKSVKEIMNVMCFVKS